MKRIVLIFVGMLGATLSISAQFSRPADLATEIRADRMKSGGVYYMYDFDTPHIVPKAPKGYKPFYISHYGRHGARFILANEHYDYTFEVLDKAHHDGKLTEAGEKIYTDVARIYPDLRGHAGELTRKGGVQHRTLAERMYDRYPGVFKANPHVEASSTEVLRCIISMGHFMSGLSSKDSHINFRTTVNGTSTCILNPYHSSKWAKFCNSEDIRHKGYDADWYPAYKEYCGAIHEKLTVLDRIFTDTAYARENFDLVHFQNFLFFFATSLVCTDYDDVDLMSFYSDEELIELFKCDSYWFWAQKAGAPYYTGRSQLLSTILLDDLLDVTQADLRSGECGARLRFGHDGCFLGLYSLMGFEGWSTITDDPDAMLDEYRTYDIPMAANLQMIFYRSKDKNAPILFRFEHNENTLPLPALSQDYAPYYRWDEFYNFYHKISVDCQRKNGYEVSE